MPPGWPRDSGNPCTRRRFCHTLPTPYHARGMTWRELDIQLADSRILPVLDAGTAESPAVVFFHSAPGPRLIPDRSQEQARAPSFCPGVEMTMTTYTRTDHLAIARIPGLGAC